MTHAIPSECPKCGSMFLEHQRAGSVLRTCMGPSCTMAQWVVAGVAKGTVADHDTRRWRATAHFEIDTLWSEGLLTLQEAYSRIAEKMGVQSSTLELWTRISAGCASTWRWKCSTVLRVSKENWRDQPEARGDGHLGADRVPRLRNLQR